MTRTYTSMSHGELVAECINLKRLLSGERRRHSAIETLFTKTLNDLETHLAEVKLLCVATMAPKPQRSER
jgi:uncharacterized iron-regulated protein